LTGGGEGVAIVRKQAPHGGNGALGIS
jgi:hypothetical protein